VSVPQKRDAVATWFHSKYPSGPPPGTTNKELARQFAAETNSTVGERTVRRALGGR
jgi:hypothetical protein